MKTDFDKSGNFGAIKTVAVKIGTSWNNQISEKRITDEIANPDALVLLHGVSETQRSRHKGLAARVFVLKDRAPWECPEKRLSLRLIAPEED